MTPNAEVSRPSTSGFTLTRRGFVQAGGALFVSIGLPAATPDSASSVDPTRLASWLEIRSDSTILMRTGRTETGTGMSAFYAQTAAEELNVRPETITLVLGDTDKTPDGGYSAGFLTGAANVRKVAAYTFQALLGLASTHLGVPVSALAAEDGMVTGGGKSVSYGQLVQGQQLDLKIPISGVPAKVDATAGNGMAGLDGYVVEGNPPLKPVSQYKVIGRSYPMPGIPDKVTGRTKWSCDVRLPGMLHARVVRPATLGSTLISAGVLDRKRFPTAEVVRKRNLLAVVSPNEWEAISAARVVGSSTKWTDWSGLPGSENLTRTLREHDWGAPNASRGQAAEVNDALVHAAKRLSASYEQPYTRHAPLGPFVSVADVRPDGSVTVWTHSSHSQGLRAQIANMLSISTEKVVVRWLEQAGQYGRTTFGGDGADADAVILSQLTGTPVRVQWSLQEDLAWSTVSPGWFADVQAGLDANGHLTAVQCRSYAPHQFDARLSGAILAGLPCSTSKPNCFVATEWPYDRIAHRLEEVYGMPNLAAESASGGLRGNIMRTPGQRQQNFVLEGLINEAAAAAGADPVQFRLNHTTDQRLIDILNATAKAANWKPRPSPSQSAQRSGSGVLTGRGVSIIVRSNAYWVGIAEVAVVPDTGSVQVTKFTIGIECGKIINPRQLDRCMRGGLVMGLSEALKEEVTFDKSKVTSTDWTSYRILTMQETPEIQVVQLSRDDKGFGTGGEAANAVGPPTVAAAFFDATGVQARRIPLTPAYVSALLKG
ncbi:molybdopterin cofactor-binding domain-containing protein [uncultured Paludibaculum sp.]|uniref:xanthine dehydrogenase family protein molybdopterin-binding subunit n=1 Tax=uncultured Paludibaculum sp. TaxID=1765020 RepID=UPI002AAA8276|nr:molybdopterin cofactor-binding domain-containing protein [uncultured Paludibaculum sp.]